MNQPCIKIARLIFVLFISVSTAKDGAGIPSPTPPRIPGGFADDGGKAGFFAGAGGGIDAVDLATGQGRWISKRGRWPLFSSHGWVAVVAPPDAEHKNALRLRFLKPSDGSLLSETAPIGEIAIGMEAATNEAGIFWGDRNGSFSLSASPLPQGLLLRSVANHMLITGMMPPQQTRKPDTGMFYINPVDGKVEKAPVSAATSLDSTTPKLPKGWKKDGHSSYFNGSWSDKPRPFRIADEVMGFFSCDYTAKRVILNRWRNGEPLPPVDVIEGTEHVPILSLDGRYAVLTSYVNGNNLAQLFDLYFMKNGTPLADLPFPEGFRFPFTVIGPLLYYVTETRMPDGAEKTLIKRTLVALDWEKGKVRWTHLLAPRYDYPPIPGAG